MLLISATLFHDIFLCKHHHSDEMSQSQIDFPYIFKRKFQTRFSRWWQTFIAHDHQELLLLDDHCNCGLDLGQLDNGWPGMVDISIKAVELFDHQVTNLCWGKQFTIEITVTLLTLTFDDKDNWKSRVAVKECKTIWN